MHAPSCTQTYSKSIVYFLGNNIVLVHYIMPCEHTGTRPCTLLSLTATTTEKSSYGMSFLGSVIFIINFVLHTNFYTCTTDSSTHGALIIPHGHCVDNPSTKSEKQYLSVIKKDCSLEDAPSVYIPII